MSGMPVFPLLTPSRSSNVPKALAPPPPRDTAKQKPDVQTDNPTLEEHRRQVALQGFSMLLTSINEPTDASQ